MVKIKTREKFLNELIHAGKKHPESWKAVFGKDTQRMSRDYYIFNPNVGIFLLKEYQKNPFQVKGIGGKIARRVDDEIENIATKPTGDFGIIQGDYRKVLKNLERGHKPDDILKAAIKGKKDLGIKMPIKGHASSSNEIYENIKNNLSDKQKKIDTKLEEIAEDDGLYKSYD